VVGTNAPHDLSGRTGKTTGVGYSFGGAVKNGVWKYEMGLIISLTIHSHDPGGVKRGCDGRPPVYGEKTNRKTIKKAVENALPWPQMV